MIRTQAHRALLLGLACLIGLVDHHRRADGLFRDAWQKRSEEECFCQASRNLLHQAGGMAAEEPQIGIEQLRKQSAELRQIEAEWRRIWSSGRDDAAHLSYQRLDGGMQ